MDTIKETTRILDTVRIVSARELAKLAGIPERSLYRQVGEGKWNDCRTPNPYLRMFRLPDVEKKLGRTILDDEILAVQLMLAAELRRKNQQTSRLGGDRATKGQDHARTIREMPVRERRNEPGDSLGIG